MNLNKKLKKKKNTMRIIENAVYRPGYDHVNMALLNLLPLTEKKFWGEKEKMMVSPFPKMFLKALFQSIF